MKTLKLLSFLIILMVLSIMSCKKAGTTDPKEKQISDEQALAVNALVAKPKKVLFIVLMAVYGKPLRPQTHLTLKR